MLKRIFVAIMIVNCCVLFFGCSKQVSLNEEQEVDTITTWQEYYDLGMRYLTDGNYTEAIIAFTNAISIDPKVSELYIALSEAYLGEGNYTEALSALESGLAATGDERFNEEIQKFKSDILHQNAYGELAFEYRKGFIPYDELTEEQVTGLETIIAHAESENLLGFVDATVGMLDEYEHLSTIRNGEKLSVYWAVTYSSRGDGRSAYLEIRPENGSGRYYAAAYGETWRKYYRAQCGCVDWQWNGAMTSYEHEEERNNGNQDVRFTETTQTGSMLDNYCDGEFSATRTMGESRSETTCVFNKGFYSGEQTTIYFRSDGVEEYTGETIKENIGIECNIFFSESHESEKSFW